VKVFGRTADEAGTWKVGNVLRVSGRLGGRDWQGKVFGDIVATRVDVVGKGSASAADDNRHAEEDAQQQMDPDELPF
jgi:single-stranded DNA-binding protein